MRHSLFLALVAVIALPLIADDASGQFTASKHSPITPKYAAAFETRDQRDARKRVVEVVLSEAPIDANAAIAEIDPHSNVINQPALNGHNYILLWVRPNNDVSMNATYSENMTQFVDMTPGSLQAQISELTPDRVAGRLFTTKSIKTMDGETYSLDVKFATPIARSSGATKLPAGGGEPGKALTSLFSAISKKNWAAIKSNVTAKNVESFDDLNDALQSFNMFLPKKAGKITGGELRGDSAILEMEADYFEGQPGLFLVKMLKSGDRWQFDRATRAGLIDSK